MTADIQIHHTAFTDLGLSSQFSHALSEVGFNEPTPIQKKVIPTVLIGRDVLAAAQTGTGKTASFLLPMIDILSVSRARARIPRGLILSPTRELALQTANQAAIFIKDRNLSIATLIGGSYGSDQQKLLQNGVDIVIATPGRLIDNLNRGKIILRGISVVVIDEADRMLDMGFIPDVTEILSYLPKTRQTLMFSATLPKGAKELAETFLTQPKQIIIEASKDQSRLVKQTFITCAQRSRKSAILASLAETKPERGFIFCNRKVTVDALCQKLKEEGYHAYAMHGDLLQSQREHAIAQLKSMPGTILVCSDVAGRGLDVNDLSHVYNFDFPNNADDYVHRIGRTGRAGKLGHAISFLDDDWADNLEHLGQFLNEADCNFLTYTGNQQFSVTENLLTNKQSTKDADEKPPKNLARHASRDGRGRRPRNEARTTPHARPAPRPIQNSFQEKPEPRPRTAPVHTSGRSRSDSRPTRDSTRTRPSNHTNKKQKFNIRSPRFSAPDGGDHIPAFLEEPVSRDQANKSTGFNHENLPAFLRPIS